MDSDRFDALTRSLVRSSRRRAVATLIGTGLGTGAVLRGLDESEAGKKDKKKKKKHTGWHMLQGPRLPRRRNLLPS
jgi:hypothetical protein